MPRRRSRRPKRGIHVSPKGGTFMYRSGWERQYAEWLDANPDVVSYEYELLVIPYVSNAGSKRLRKYIPDFVVTFADGHREVHEVKPARRVHHARILKKSIAAGEWCRANGMTFHLVTEVELKALGLLKPIPKVKKVTAPRKARVKKPAVIFRP